jgi:hypothetical protein
MKRKKKPPRCRAKTKTGKRCTRRAVNGNRCNIHPVKKAGRHKIKWGDEQWKRFDTFCAARESKRDIAEAMQNDIKTIDAICKREKGVDFSTYCDQKRGYGRSLVAGKQLEIAMSGSVAMLIWLGKQWLDQKEPKQSHEYSGPDGGPIQHATQDLSKLTREELALAKQLVNKTTVDSSGD